MLKYSGATGILAFFIVIIKEIFPWFLNRNEMCVDMVFIMG
jgi:hypothetical protein